MPNPWLLLAALVTALGLAAAAAWGGHEWTARHYKQVISERDTADAVATLTAEHEAREKEQAWQEIVDKKERGIQDEQRKNTSLAFALSGSRTDISGLRKQLSGFAAGTAGGDSIAACRAEAGTLAALLASGAEIGDRLRDLAVRSAKDHDDRAAEVEGLLASWPRNTPQAP